MKHSSKTKRIAKRIDFFLNKLEHKKSHKKFYVDKDICNNMNILPPHTNNIYNSTNNIDACRNNNNMTNNNNNNNIIVNNTVLRQSQAFNIFNCQTCCTAITQDQCLNEFNSGFTYLLVNGRYINQQGAVDVNRLVNDFNNNNSLVSINSISNMDDPVVNYRFYKLNTESANGQVYLTGIFQYIIPSVNRICNLSWFWIPITLANNGLFNIGNPTVKYITCLDGSGACNLNNQIVYLLYSLLLFRDFYFLDITTENILFNNLSGLNSILNTQLFIYTSATRTSIIYNTASQTVNPDGSSLITFGLLADTCNVFLNVAVDPTGVITSITSV